MGSSRREVSDFSDARKLLQSKVTILDRKMSGGVLWSEAVHGDALGESAVEVGQRFVRRQQERVTIGEAYTAQARSKDDGHALAQSQRSIVSRGASFPTPPSTDSRTDSLHGLIEWSV